MWPWLVVYPLASAALARVVYMNGDWLVAQARALGATLQGLVVDWVYAPTMRLLATLRTGRSRRELLVRGESLAADELSLERMVAALGRDTLRLSGDDLDALVQRTNQGDLTPVLELYESAIRSPLRGVLAGSLVRTLLIQVQKAKVDLELAMQGIDWLLASQELLLCAVGLAPALALTYALAVGAARVVGWAARRPGAPRHDLGAARLAAWCALRRLDQACHTQDTPSAQQYGYVLLDVRTLRISFDALLPRLARRGARHAWLREAHADLDELEAPGVAADANTRRRATVARMWRSWGGVLRV